MNYQLPIHRTKKPFIAGLDPDVDKCGLAIYSRLEKKWVLLQTLDDLEAQETLVNYGFDQIQVVVEAGYENKGMLKYHKDSLPKNFEDWKKEAQWGYMFKRGVDVGINHYVGMGLVKFLKRNHFEVTEWVPKIAKWNAADLASIAKLTMRTNQEIRDAIRAAFMNI